MGICTYAIFCIVGNYVLCYVFTYFNFEKHYTESTPNAKCIKNTVTGILGFFLLKRDLR